MRKPTVLVALALALTLACGADRMSPLEVAVTKVFPLTTKVGNRGPGGLSLVWTPWPNDQWEIIEQTGVVVEEVDNYLVIHSIPGTAPRFEIRSTETFNLKDDAFYYHVRTFPDRSGRYRLFIDGTDSQPGFFSSLGDDGRLHRVAHVSAAPEFERLKFQRDLGVGNPWNTGNSDPDTGHTAVQLRFLWDTPSFDLIAEDGDRPAWISPFNQPPESFSHPLIVPVYPIPGSPKIYPLVTQVGDVPGEEE